MRITTRQYFRACGIITVALFVLAAASVVGRAYRPAEAVAEQVQPGSSMRSELNVRSRRLRTALATCRADLQAVKATAQSQ